MSRYARITESLGDSLTEAIEQVQDRQVDLARRARERVDLPKLLVDGLDGLRDGLRSTQALQRRVTDASWAWGIGLLDALGSRKRPTRPTRSTRPPHSAAAAAR